MKIAINFIYLDLIEEKLVIEKGPLLPSFHLGEEKNKQTKHMLRMEKQTVLNPLKFKKINLIVNDKGFIVHF